MQVGTALLREDQLIIIGLAGSTGGLQRITARGRASRASLALDCTLGLGPE